MSAARHPLGSVVIPAQYQRAGVRRGLASRSHAVPILQLFALTLMVIPSDTVIRAIGANGFPASIVGMFAFAAFVAATLFGFHDPLQHRHPIRTMFLLMWISVLVSYVLMDRAVLSITETASADRLLIQLAVLTGVALVAAECLDSLHDVRRVLRALTWGGAFCGVVAALQFWMSLDLTPYLRELPGFSQNFDNPAIISRAAFNRVTGTTIQPIELGVVSAMLLPPAIYLALFDTQRSLRRRWLTVALIALGIPASVSRSGFLAIGVALVVLVVLMPPRQRLGALCAMPLAIVTIFMTARGLIGTMKGFFEAGTSDPSISTRVDDYAMVDRLVREAPWFGHGGNTYIADNMLDILDNQFLKTAIEQGLVGVVVLVAYLLVPVFAALIARHHSRDPELRLLCAALGASVLAGAISSVTFDSFSFPMFAHVHALLLGLIGAGWRLAARARQSEAKRSREEAFAGPPSFAVTPLRG